MGFTLTLVKVQAKKHGEWKDFYVEVPSYLYEEALVEKKSHPFLFDYAYHYQIGHLPKFSTLKLKISEIIKVSTNLVDDCIERIHITKPL